jgi:mono/diheme cytochrome c family protein
MAAALRGLIVALLLAGCERSLPDEEPATGGNPKQGRQLIQHFGCGSCHRISGVPGANATVAPPLEKLKRRVYIAGRFANTPDNLVQWIRDPRAMDSQTAMPAVGVDEAQARDIAAYLYAR